MAHFGVGVFIDTAEPPPGDIPAPTGGRTTGGKKVEVPEFEEFEGPYVQEHVDLLNSILKQAGLKR